MSTRGFVGFKTNTKEDRKGNLFGIYNHYDSYYSYTGVDILDTYRDNTPEYFKGIFKSISWTAEENEKSLSGIDLMKGEYAGEELFNCPDFLDDGLFCEYGYVYNLETDELEVYRGFFKEPQFEELRDLGAETYDKSVTYHTHRVLTITRDSDFDTIKYMFEKYHEIFDSYQRDDIRDGKYMEEVYLQNYSKNLDSIMAIIDEYI